MCKCVHTTKYMYMLKILILTLVQINSQRNFAFAFLLKRPQDFKCVFDLK